MKKLYLICVDDQRDVLNSIVRDLRALSEWVQIEECESASEARTLMDELDAEGAALALVISDHIMPEQNGVDFLATLADDPRFFRTGRVLLTGQASHKDTIEAINRAHIHYYVEKPWQPDDLIALCRRLLTQYLFDTDRYENDYRTFVDQQVVLTRLRATE